MNYVSIWGKSKPLNGLKLGSDIFHLHFRKIVLWPLIRKQTGSREIPDSYEVVTVLMRDNGDPRQRKNSADGEEGQIRRRLGWM